MQRFLVLGGALAAIAIAGCGKSGGTYDEKAAQESAVDGANYLSSPSNPAAIPGATPGGAPPPVAPATTP